MVAVKAQVSLPYKSSVPTDVAVNVWSFEIDDDTETEYAQVQGFLFEFYKAVCPFLSPVLDITKILTKIYLRSDPQPQVPKYDLEWGTGVATASDPIPEECAVCLSFKGVSVSGVPPARRRGRIYLGPLGDNTVLEDASGRARVNGSFDNAIEAGIVAGTAELTTAGNAHTVWSETTSTNVVIASYWVDNAFDTQRRRGPVSTSRATWVTP